ncbi:unnamed protein product, partial [marine sediment metagenome]
WCEGKGCYGTDNVCRSCLDKYNDDEERWGLELEVEAGREAEETLKEMNMVEVTTAGHIKVGGWFCLEIVPGHRRWFRRVGSLLLKAGITLPDVLPDAVTGLPTRSHQNSIIVQEQFTGQFSFLECAVEVTLPRQSRAD